MRSAARLFLGAALAAAAVAPASAQLAPDDVRQVFDLMARRAGIRAALTPAKKEDGRLTESLAGKNGRPASITFEPKNLPQACPSRGQLAFAFGHELAHILHRDGERLDAYSARLSSAWFESRGERLRRSGASEASVRSEFEADMASAYSRLNRSFEFQADAAAQAWLTDTIDPETGLPFGADQAAAALRSIQAWRAARRLPDDLPNYPPLSERIAKLEGR